MRHPEIRSTENEVRAEGILAAVPQSSVVRLTALNSDPLAACRLILSKQKLERKSHKQAPPRQAKLVLTGSEKGLLPKVAF